MVKRFSTSRLGIRLPREDHNVNGGGGNGGNSDGGPHHSSHSSNKPDPATGAIVGIILGVIVLLAAGGVFWFRRRSIANRSKKRKWAKQQENPPSFLFIEPKEPVTSSNMRRGRDPVVPVNMMFAGPDGMTQPRTGFPYISSPVPRPPPAASIYNVHTPPGTMSPSDVSTRVLSPLVKSSFPPSPSPPKQAEIAKVHSTFIPTLPDELTISTREMVRIHAEYDDGWCLCSNARGEMGMVPLECLDRASQLPRERPGNREYRRSVRVSSLSTIPRSPYGGNTLRSPSVLRSPHVGNQQ